MRQIILGNNVYEHTSVLLKESIEALQIKPDGVYLDGTFGRGGHSREILSKLNESGLLYAIDRDSQAVEFANLIDDKRFIFAHGEFSDFNSLFHGLEKNSLDGVLLDLGVSSPQLDDAQRGFSFTRDGVLDMRMNQQENVMSAEEFVNNAEYGELVRIIATFGEERFAKNIARKIIKARLLEPIVTTKQLAEIVRQAVPAKYHVEGKHPATRTFQAIRIHINKELDELTVVLRRAFVSLKAGARLVVISFHSLEDSYVKKFVKEFSDDQLPAEIPVLDASVYKKLKLIGRPVRPSAEEIELNPRARSSIMRIVEKL